MPRACQCCRRPTKVNIEQRHCSRSLKKKSTYMTQDHQFETKNESPGILSCTLWLGRFVLDACVCSAGKSGPFVQ